MDQSGTLDFIGMGLEGGSRRVKKLGRERNEDRAKVEVKFT